MKQQGRSNQDILEDIKERQGSDNWYNEDHFNRALPEGYDCYPTKQFKDRRDEHLWMLERRARHLQKRIRSSSDKVLTMDKKELQALRWALSEVDG